MDLSVKNKKYSKILYTLLLLILTLFTSLSLSSNPYSEFLPGHDSSMFQYFGYAMANGKTIYTEIFDHKGPMIFILNWLGTVLSIGNVKGIYIIEFLSLFIYFKYSFKTFSLFINNIFSIILLVPQGLILMDFMEKGNLTEVYALPYIGLSIYIFTKYYVKNVKSYEIILLGISCAMVFSLRANMVVLWLVFSMLIFIEKVIKKEFKILVNYIVMFISGLLIIFVPISIYLLVNGAFKEGIYQSLIFNFLYLEQSNSKEDAIRILYTLLSNNFIIIPSSLFLIFTGVEWKDLDDTQRTLYIGIIFFAIASFFASTMSGRAYRHYLIAMVPTVTLPLAILFNKLLKRNNLAIIFLTMISMISIFYIQIEDRYEALVIENIGNVESIDDSHIQDQIINNKNYTKQIIEVANVIKENTTYNDEIYVHRKAGNLYLLSNRLSSVRYFNLPAVNINENNDVANDFIDEITNSNPAIIVLDNTYIDSTKMGVDKEFFDYVMKEYELLQNINGYYLYWYNTDN